MVDRFVRPDFSDFVVHFTKGTAPFSFKEEGRDLELDRVRGLSAGERLIAILRERRLRATKMPWTNKPAVCFTECTWGSLLDHANRYSRFGLGFSKAYLFGRGGAPAIYLTPGLMEHQKQHTGSDNQAFHGTLFSFVTPFCPSYAPQEYKDRFWDKRRAVDYTHEREWRVPHDLDFQLQDVAFVIAPSYEEMARAPAEIKDETGRANWLLMDNYEKIESLWPVHRLPRSRKN